MEGMNLQLICVCVNHISGLLYPDHTVNVEFLVLHEIVYAVESAPIFSVIL